MKKYINKGAQIINNLFVEAPKMIRIAFDAGRLPDVLEARTYLQQFSPDSGKSCWIDNGFKYLKRTRMLSVIVPAYNVEKYIDACLESILRQHVSFDYEIIIVNDGSVDATPQLLQKYEQDGRIHVIHQENGGLSSARNTGITWSKGEYLCFVDGDDELPDHALEYMMEGALQENVKLVIGSYERCFRSGKVQYTRILKDKKADIKSLPGYAWGRVIHYSVFQNLRFPEGYWFEDSIMAQIVHPLCKDTTYSVSGITYRYYVNETGITAIARANPKAIDSLWITMRLLADREKYHLCSTQSSYAYFLSMVNLTYARTRFLGLEVAKCIFVIQNMLIERYYAGYHIEDDKKKQKIQNALRENNFRKYVLACMMRS